MESSTVTEAMRRYREGLASRGVRQIQANLPDAMIDWIDQFAAEKGLNRSSMIEVLARLGAARMEAELGEMGAAVVDDPRSTLFISPPGGQPFAPVLASALEALAPTHLLYVSAQGGAPRNLPRDLPSLVCEWRGAAAVQGQRFNPLAPSVVPPDAQARRLYVRWLAHALAPDRGDGDAPFSDTTRQLLEETILALEDPAQSLEQLALSIEAMPWPPSGGGLPATPNKRVIDLMAAQHKGLAHFAGRDEKALIGVIEAARDALAPFRAQEMRRLTSTDDGLLGRLEGAPAAVLLPDVGLRSPAARLAAMLVTAAIARRLQSRPHGPRAPLVVVLDDLGSLPRIPALEEAVTVGHRHGLYIVATAHSFRQIEARYGEATALSLRACARVLSTAEPLQAG